MLTESEFFLRKAIGWALDRTMEDALTLTALRMALRLRQPIAGSPHSAR
jgi:3-methyladenine DNA glycosylase AlkD